MKLTRRQIILGGLKGAAVAAFAAVAGLITSRASAKTTVWQIDPEKCVQCGLCATCCVLKTSAVKCVHAFDLCGNCDPCTGYLELNALDRDTAAENVLCPTNAIRRRLIYEPLYEYTIDEDRCVGCAKCARGCSAFGNGSLFMQVRHDRCLNCNQCAIAAACPAQAFVRLRANSPYKLKSKRNKAVAAPSSQPAAGAPEGKA